MPTNRIQRLIAVGLTVMATVAALGLALGATLYKAQVGSAQPAGSRVGSPGKLFDYDRAAPLDTVLGKSSSWQGVVRQELEFNGAESLRLEADFVHPVAGGPWPLVIWSPGAGFERRQQLPEALAAARIGLASLLIDKPNLGTTCRDAKADLAATVDYVVSRRRAVDVAETLPNVDTTRIAAVGASQGAAVTAMLSGVEHRIVAFALQSGRGHLAGWIRIFCTFPGAKQQAAYIAKVSVVDPVHWVHSATRAAFLIQNGTSDKLTPRADVLALYAAARKPKELHWYRAAHGLNAAATAYLRAWLLRHLRRR